jgi:hypothetical protein
MWITPPRPLRPGSELTTGWLNWLLACVKRNSINVGVNSGLAMVQTENGTILRVAKDSGGQQLAITDGTITARVGTTPGTGNVFTVSYDGTNLITDPNFTDLAVFNFSSTTGGIPTTTYVWITQDPQQNWWVTSVDCGNA